MTEPVGDPVVEPVDTPVEEVLPEVPVVTDAVVETISAQCPDVTDEHVAMVLAAWNTIITGEAIGTIKLDPVSGNLAVRVSEDGVHKWKVTTPTGEQWSDMSPTIPGWTVLKQG